MNEAQEKAALQRGKGYEGLRLDELMQSEIKPAIKELDTEVRELPRLDRNGQSECPFAAQLYAQKERKAAKVAELLTRMRYKLETIDTEIVRCLKNLHVVGEGSAKIHSNETNKNLIYVATTLKEQLRDAQEDSKRAKGSIEEMERVLTYSARIAHPDVPTVGVPAWPPADRKTTENQKPAPPFSVTPPVISPLPLPLPIPPGPPFGLGRGDAWLPPPIPGGPRFGRDQWICPKPPPIPHPVGGTDMLLNPPKSAIYR